jgi:hypothetical protein
MTLRIIVDIFSGRPNPIIELSGAAARDFLKRVMPLKKAGSARIQNPDWHLGYRGLLVEQLSGVVQSLPPVFRLAAGTLYGVDVAHATTDAGLEEEFFSPRGAGAKLKIPGIADPLKLLRKAIGDLARTR